MHRGVEALIEIISIARVFSRLLLSSKFVCLAREQNPVGEIPVALAREQSRKSLRISACILFRADRTGGLRRAEIIEMNVSFKTAAIKFLRKEKGTGGRKGGGEGGRETGRTGLSSAVNDRNISLSLFPRT